MQRLFNNLKGLTMNKLTTRKEYDEIKAKVEALIAEATDKGMLEPEMDNEYTRQISDLSKLMAQYEDEYMEILPLREKTPLIRSIEDYFYAHNMKQKEGAQYLGINESVFSQILSGKRRITMPIAKRLHSKLGINADMILKYA
jgi:antitoxin component HigA of HigAB toxin-antitoxin module